MNNILKQIHAMLENRQTKKLEELRRYQQDIKKNAKQIEKAQIEWKTMNETLDKFWEILLNKEYEN